MQGIENKTLNKIKINILSVGNDIVSFIKKIICSLFKIKFIYLATPWGMRDFSSLTIDQIWTPYASL